MAEKRVTWIEATTNQASKIIIGMMAIGIVWLVQQAYVAQQGHEANKIQWKKISALEKQGYEREIAQLEDKVCQAEINGYTRAKIECLEGK